jgi:Tetratricopeptide repeat
MLLRVVAVLSPDGVRRDVLGGLAAPGGSARNHECEEEESQGAIDAAMERCVAGSLLTWSVTRDAVIMHRLLGRVLRERDQADNRLADTVTAALDLLEPQLFSQDQAWTRREEGAHLAAQTEALWEVTAGDAGAGDRGLALRLVRARSWAVWQLGSAADLSRAIDAGIRTLADSKLALGPDHPLTLTSLAAAYTRAGRLEQAIPLHEQTVADRERILGADHPNTLTSRDNLAYAYQLGRLFRSGDPAA